jgi:hypothetical protein
VKVKIHRAAFAGLRLGDAQSDLSRYFATPQEQPMLRDHLLRRWRVSHAQSAYQ